MIKVIKDKDDFKLLVENYSVAISFTSIVLDTLPRGTVIATLKRSGNFIASVIGIEASEVAGQFTELGGVLS
jgi:hypothetical protein